MSEKITKQLADNLIANFYPISVYFDARNREITQAVFEKYVDEQLIPIIKARQSNGPMA